MVRYLARVSSLLSSFSNMMPPLSRRPEQASIFESMEKEHLEALAYAFISNSAVVGSVRQSGVRPL